MPVTLASALGEQIIAYLVSRSLPPVASWVDTFVASQKPNIPATALRQTALFRLLASDLQVTLQRTSANTFPPDVLDSNTIERRVTGPVPVQVLDVEDVGRSRWSQVEAIEAAERGETTKGREIIRVVPNDDNGQDTAAASAQKFSAGPHKLLLQDANGLKAYAFEMTGIKDVNTDLSIGAKLLLENFRVLRGVIMLEPATTSVLGGKMDALHAQWTSSRKERLTARIDAAA